MQRLGRRDFAFPGLQTGMTLAPDGVWYLRERLRIFRFAAVCIMLAPAPPVNRFLSNVAPARKADP